MAAVKNEHWNRPDRLLLWQRGFLLFFCLWTIAGTSVTGIALFQSSYKIPWVSHACTPHFDGAVIKTCNDVTTTQVNPGAGFVHALSAFQPELDTVCGLSVNTDFEYELYTQQLVLNNTDPANVFLHAQEIPTGRRVPIVTLAFSLNLVLAVITFVLFIQTFIFGNMNYDATGKGGWHLRFMPAPIDATQAPKLENVSWYNYPTVAMGFQWMRKLGTTAMYIMSLVSIAPPIGLNSELGLGGLIAAVFTTCVFYIFTDSVLSWCALFVAPDPHAPKKEKYDETSVTNSRSNARTYFNMVIAAFIPASLIHVWVAATVISYAHNSLFMTDEAISAYGIFRADPAFLFQVFVAIAMIIWFTVFFFTYLIHIIYVFQGSSYLYQPESTDHEHSKPGSRNQALWYIYRGKFNVDLILLVLSFLYMGLYNSIFMVLLNGNKSAILQNLEC